MRWPATKAQGGRGLESSPGLLRRAPGVTEAPQGVLGNPWVLVVPSHANSGPQNSPWVPRGASGDENGTFNELRAEIDGGPE